jgi:hypothetical protein
MDNDLPGVGDQAERVVHWQRLTAVMQLHYWGVWRYPASGWQRYRWGETSTGHPFVRVDHTTYYLVYRDAPAEFAHEVVLAFRLGHVTVITPEGVNEGGNADFVPPLVEPRPTRNGEPR